MVDYSMTGASTLQTSFQIAQLITAFAGIALYNAVELLVLIAITFRARKGLYFWSLVVSTVAIVLYTLGLLFKFFGVINVTMLCIAIIDVGWQCMVTGQSVVLYSRLHLVASSRRKLKWILSIIIANVFVSNVPTTIFVFGSVSAHNGPFLKPYAFWERFQLCCYFVQEAVISGLYVFEIARILRPDGYGNSFEEDAQRRTDQERGVMTAPTRKVRTQRGRRVMKHLLYVNIVIVILDITLLVTEFIGHYEIQVLYKATVYSMKLKLEFRILNQLTEIAQEKLRTSQAYFSAQSESLASPLATSGSGCAPPWSGKDGSPGSPGTPLHDSHTVRSPPVEQEVAGANALRRFGQTDRRMANIDESTMEGPLSTPTRPLPVRMLTAPASAVRRNSVVSSPNGRRVSIV